MSEHEPNNEFFAEILLQLKVSAAVVASLGKCELLDWHIKNIEYWTGRPFDPGYDYREMLDKVDLNEIPD
jgi:hypothetical protein